MPITQVEKIWMDGELVDWRDANVHVLSHAVHYGTGVFEGIRAYQTAMTTLIGASSGFTPISPYPRSTRGRT